MISGSLANRNRKGCGTLGTHRRTGRSGNTSSTRWVALSAMRRAPQLGQNPRLLQLKATSRSARQPSQATRRKPCSSRPQARKSSNSRATYRGRNLPSAASRASKASVVLLDEPVEQGLLGAVARIRRRTRARTRSFRTAALSPPDRRTASAVGPAGCPGGPADRDVANTATTACASGGPDTPAGGSKHGFPGVARDGCRARRRRDDSLPGRLSFLSGALLDSRCGPE